MSVRLRVVNGTLPNVRLCDSCRWSTIMKNDKGGEKIACRTNGAVVRITDKVVDCSSYNNRNDKTAYELQQIGWILEVKGKTILGFRQPKSEDKQYNG